MKRLMCLILTAVFLLGAAGCGENPEQPTTVPATTAAPAVQTESLLRIGVDEAPSACLAGTLVSRNETDRLLWELLSDYSPFVTDVNGQLAENPSVMEDCTITRLENNVLLCTIKFREGLCYSSGRPIRSGDYVLPLLYGAISGREDLGYRMFVGSDDYASGASDFFSGIRLPDERTLQLQLDPTYAQSFYAFHALRLQPWNPEFWLGEGWSIGDLGQGACLVSDGSAFRMEPDRLDEQIRTAGTDLTNLDCAGPYRISQVLADRLVLTRSPGYVGNFENYQPQIETLEFYTVTDPAKALEAGSVDLIPRITDPSEAAKLGKIPGYVTLSYPRNGYTMLRFNCAAGPTQFAEVRQALACFLDRESLSRAIGSEAPVHGPYTPAMWQARQSQRFLQELNPYAFDRVTAEGYLVAGGWTLDERGGQWSGSGLRYKEVTKQQAQTFGDCLTLSDGRILMPLILHISAAESYASEALARALENEAISQNGMQILLSTMSFKELQASFPSCSAALMTEEYTSAVYNHAFRYTQDPELLELGCNPTGLMDEQLDILSTAMVYSPEPGDWETYLGLWQQYILRCNELLPELPLGIGTSTTVLTERLSGYQETALWDLAHTILYCTVTD